MLSQLLTFCAFNLWFSAIVSANSPVASPECIERKDLCEKDRECKFALTYLHTSCITGMCDPHCIFGVLKLYHLPRGRELLKTDLTCVAMVASEIKSCNLHPGGSTLYCTLGRSICEHEPACRTALDIYTTECDSQLKKSECTDTCGEHLANVFMQPEIGPKLVNCTCGKTDELCKNEKKTVFTGCQRLAESIVAGKSRPNQANMAMLRSHNLLFAAVFIIAFWIV